MHVPKMGFVGKAAMRSPAPHMARLTMHFWWVSTATPCPGPIYLLSQICAFFVLQST